MNNTSCKLKYDDRDLGLKGDAPIYTNFSLPLLELLLDNLNLIDIFDKTSLVESPAGNPAN